MADKKTVTHGSIELEVNNSKDTTYVPTFSPAYIDQSNHLSTISYAVKEDLPVLLIGETGTGKTSAVRHLAKETNNNLRRVNLNGSTTVEELVGKILINKDGTYWVDGVLTECMRNGYWILIDEINAALPEVLFVLHSLLDDDRYIVLSEKEDKEIVRPHPNFRVFGTMNPFEDYVGTKELNKAFLSRFPITIRVNYPDQKTEKQILETRFPDRALLPSDIVDQMIEVVHSARDSREKEDLDFVFSTRDLIQWATVYLHTQSARQAAEMTILPKCNKNDAKALRNVINLSFASEGGVQLRDLKRGQMIKLKANVVVTNLAKVIPFGTVLSIQDFMKMDGTNAPQSSRIRKYAEGVRIRVERVLSHKELQDFSTAFCDAENLKHLVKPTEEWTIDAKELEDKFIPVKA